MFRLLKIIAGIVLIISVFLFIISYFRKNELPSGDFVSNDLTNDPLQLKTDKLPFSIDKGDYSYDIEPKFTYEIKGLVVADYNSENWFDFSHKDDPLNTKDECLVWGKNVEDEVYNKIDFTHGEFTCFAKVKDKYAKYDLWNTDFSTSDLSNNHLLPASNKVYNKMKEAGIGDQISIKGYLANYTVFKDGRQIGSRKTSTVRDDTGDGACEVIYVTDFEIIQKGNAFYYLANKVSFWTAIISLILLIISYFTRIAPKDNSYFIKEPPVKRWTEEDNKSSKVFPAEFK